MNSRYRGYKASHSRRLDLSRPRRRKPKYLPGEGPIRKILGAFFVMVMRIFSWIFHKKGFWRRLTRLGIVVGLVGFIVLGSMFVFYSFRVPDPNKLVSRVVPESTKIFDRDGELLYEVFGEAKRTLVTLDEVPNNVKNAAIAIEDKNFYSHSGISFTGIARAIVVDVFTASKRQGASTITQQFVRNAILTREKTFARKIKEIILALQVEDKLDKDEILQLYFNEIPYGSNSFGIQAASKTFFDKAVGELTLTESAYLAALPKAPTYFSPYGPNQDKLDDRADTVLELMFEQGYITEQERNRAQNEVVEFKPIGIGILAPHFVLYVQDLLAQKYGELGLQEGGFRVTTTLDLDLQKIAEEAVVKFAEQNEQRYGASNASLVAVDPKSGEILAMVGSRDYFDEEIDGAVNVALRLRQPGSSFKPYVYATAFRQGMNPATLLVDVVTDFGEFGGKSYVPQNYDGEIRGPLSIRKALQGSVNIPAVKTTILVGVGNAIDTAENLGISSLKDRSRFGPSIVLGGAEVRLLEHTAAFGVFGNGGIKHDTTAILKIEDADGKTLEERRESRGREVLDPQIAYQINHVLSDNDARAFVFGTNNYLTIGGRPVAAKTGTTQEFRDAWTIGYTPNLTAGVWVGNNDNSTMRKGAAGGNVAAPIWNEFMRRALENFPVEDFFRPEGITEIAVDTLSGKLPTAYTPSTKTEIFASFNVPTEFDDVHLPMIVDGQTKILTVLHSQKPDDPNWEEPVRIWAEENGFASPPPTDTPPSGLDESININLSTPRKIKELPWQVSVTIDTNESIRSVDLFLDNSLLHSDSRSTFGFTSFAPHVNGEHQLTAQVRTASGKINQESVKVDFDLGLEDTIISPANNQVIDLPQNVVLESNRDTSPLNVIFKLKVGSGNPITIPGIVSKQRVSNKIYYYALGWTKENQPASGSYELSAEVDGRVSGSILIQIP